MRTGFTVSTIAHAGLIALAIIGIGMGRPLDTPPVESIAVDLVPVSDFSNIRVGSLESTVVETEAPSAVEAEKPAEIAQPTGNTEEDQPTPADNPTPTPAPTENTAPAPDAAPEPTPEPQPEEAAPTPAERPAAEPEPQPEPTPEPTPEPVAQPEPTPVATPEPTPDPADAAPKPTTRTASLDQKRAEFKKQQDALKKQQADEKAQADAAKKKAAEDAKKKADDEKKKKAAAEQKRIEEAKAADAKKTADEVADIINNEDSRGATTGQGGAQTLGKETGRSATLSQSQLDGLAAQIKGCINMPPGAQEAGSEAKLLFTVGGDGSPVGQPQIVSASGDPLGSTYARAVVRAVMRCGPYTVVAGQDVSATFRAADF